MIESMGTFPGFGLHKCLVKLSCEIDLIIKSCHLLFVVKQLLLAYLFHISVSIVKSLHLCFSLFQSYSLGHKVSLQLFILLDNSCGIKLILPLDLIDLDILKSF